jgi:hypothetical protein
VAIATRPSGATASAAARSAATGSAKNWSPCWQNARSNSRSETGGASAPTRRAAMRLKRPGAAGQVEHGHTRRGACQLDEILGERREHGWDEELVMASRGSAGVAGPIHRGC